MAEFRGSHLDLCRDLAEHLSSQGYRAWVEIRRVGVMSYGDAGRIDVMALAPWVGRTKFDMIAFEIKTQRSDLLRDVQTGKWRRYVAEYGIPRVCFACIDGIATLDDIPSDAGLFIRRADGWKRSRGPKPLEGDQKKLDPLLLLAMLSERPFDAEYFRVKARQERIAIPDSVRDAIKAAPDADYINLIRYSTLSRDIGHDLSRRLALPSKETESIHEWAEAIVQIVAEASGKDASELREEVARSGKYSEVKRSIAVGLRYYREREVMQRLLRAASAVGSDFEYERVGISRGLKVAEAIEAEESEQMQRRRKRGAA